MVIKDQLYHKYVVVHEKKKEQVRIEGAKAREVKRAAWKNRPLTLEDEDKVFEKRKKERKYECHVIEVMTEELRMAVQGPPRMSLSSFLWVHDIARMRPLYPKRVQRVVSGSKDDSSWLGEGEEPPSNPAKPSRAPMGRAGARPRSAMPSRAHSEEGGVLGRERPQSAHGLLGSRAEGAKARPESAKSAKSQLPASATSSMGGLSSDPDLRPQSGTDPHAMVMHLLGPTMRSHVTTIYDSENIPLSFLVPSGCGAHGVVRCAVFAPPRNKATRSRSPKKARSRSSGAELARRGSSLLNASDDFAWRRTSSRAPALSAWHDHMHYAASSGTRRPQSAVMRARPMSAMSTLSRVSVATTAYVQEQRRSRPASACRCVVRRVTRGLAEPTAFGRSTSTHTLPTGPMRGRVVWA